MRLLQWASVAVALGLAVGCAWMDKLKGDRTPHPTTPVQKVTADQLVTYLNNQAGRLQTLTYADARVTSREGLMTYPTLRGNLAASQPRNFRMTGQGGMVAAKLDLGSNTDQFWMYLDAPAVKPVFVFASHTDFESGRAKLPGGIPFEPDWVMQALGMTTFPDPTDVKTTVKYEAKLDEKARTYTLSWPATTPAGMAIRKEIVFDADDVSGTRPQVKRHLIKDAKGKVLCSAEVKAAKTVPVGAAEPRSGQPPVAQYPTHVVLRWEEQKFEMDMMLDSAQVNQQLSPEQSRRLFTRPNIAGATLINLAEARFDMK
jgi:hypothetical protein